MNWITESFIMFFSSVLLYLTVRKSSLLKMPSQFNNLAMFSIPFLIYLTINITTQKNFTVTIVDLLMFIFIAIFFMYLGNVFSLISIERAPNAGYSLVISKSYVLFTTIVAIILFNAELTLKKFLAILVIIFFSALIMLGEKNKKKTINNHWLYLSLGAFFCWGLLSLSQKFLFSKGINPIVALTYEYFIVSICILTEIMTKKIKITINKISIMLFLGIGLSSASFNFFLFDSIRIAPNLGYVNAINAASISLVTIFSIILFKDEFSLKKLVGVFGVICGLILLLI